MNERTFIENYWTPIPGYYPYEAYPTGEVRNGKTKRILSPYTVKLSGKGNEQEYQVIHMQVDGMQRGVCLHRIIAMTFLPWPPGDINEYDVDHLDYDPTHNDFMNLRWLPKGINRALKANISDDARREIVEKCYEMIK